MGFNSEVVKTSCEVSIGTVFVVVFISFGGNVGMGVVSIVWTLKVVKISFLSVCKGFNIGRVVVIFINSRVVDIFSSEGTIWVRELYTVRELEVVSNGAEYSVVIKDEIGAQTKKQ